MFRSKYQFVRNFIFASLFLATNALQAQQRWAVVFFLSETCPISKSVSQEIRTLMADPEWNEVVFLAVFPMANATDSAAQKFLKKYQIDMPYFVDSQQFLVQRADVGVVPTALVVPLDAANFYDWPVEHELPTFYKGRIDTSFEQVGRRRRANIERTLALALEHIIKTETPYPAEAPAVGCLITPQTKQP
jgi:hypothetical protein